MNIGYESWSISVYQLQGLCSGPTLLCDGVSGAAYKIRLDHVLVIEMTTKVTHVLLNGISIPPPVISGEMPGG